MSGSESSGYVVYNDCAIWGYGPTPQAAWAEFEREMAMAAVEVLDDEQDSSLSYGSTTRRSAYQCRPASAALISEVETTGGNTSWGTMGGIACTSLQADSAMG